MISLTFLSDDFFFCVLIAFPSDGEQKKRWNSIFFSPLETQEMPIVRLLSKSYNNEQRNIIVINSVYMRF